MKVKKRKRTPYICFQESWNCAKPKYGDKNQVMATAKLERTSQIWLKGIDASMRWVFQCIGVNRKSVAKTFFRIYTEMDQVL